ncbi:MAG: hypothetical protein HOL70_14480 [Candidatus Marinimicrobia bacterium]|nr:hypothetical protein [Candidatus Neomarinimicrobiota bacterium]
MEQSMIVPDDVRAALSVAGWDMDSELENMSTEHSGFEIPVIRVEHRNNSKHVFYVDHGASYITEQPSELELGDTVTGVIFGHQHLRAKWVEGKEIPDCSSIEGIPVGEQPLADRCNLCEHSAIGSTCKPKIRILLLSNLEGELKPYVLHLPPTSLKYFLQHVRKLSRSNLPIVACNTVFKIKPIARNGYKYGEIEISIDGVSDRDTLMVAKQLRTEFEEFAKRLTRQDFIESGDTVSE